jgi:hypothetical protein
MLVNIFKSRSKSCDASEISLGTETILSQALTSALIAVMTSPIPNPKDIVKPHAGVKLRRLSRVQTIVFCREMVAFVGTRCSLARNEALEISQFSR